MEGPPAIIEVLKPTGRVKAVVEKTLPAVASIDNKVIGLLDNKKPNFDLFLNRLEQLLSSKYKVAGIVRKAKAHAAVAAGHEIVEELSQKCDVVITGSGD